MKTSAIAAIIGAVAFGWSNGFVCGDDQPSPKDAALAAAGMEASMSLRHARDWAEILYFKANSRASDLNAATFAEGVAGNAKAFDKSLDKLKGQAGNDADFNDRIGRLKRQSGTIQEQTARLTSLCAKSAPDAGAIATASSESWNALDLADADMAALLKSMKVVRRQPPKPGAADTPPRPADPAVTYGQGFRPHTATVYQRSILDNARVLNHYANSAGPLPDAAIADHVAEIERQLSALKQEYAKLDGNFRKENRLEQEVKEVEQHQTKVAGEIDRLKKSAAARTLNPTELRETSKLIYRSTSATLGQLNRMMTQFNTQPVEHEEPLYSP